MLFYSNVYFPNFITTIGRDISVTSIIVTKELSTDGRLGCRHL